METPGEFCCHLICFLLPWQPDRERIPLKNVTVFPPRREILCNSMTNLEFRVSLHHFQNNVTANRVSHQDQAGFSGNMFPDEGQLVFDLPVQPKHIALCCWRCVCVGKESDIWTHCICVCVDSKSTGLKSDFMCVCVYLYILDNMFSCAVNIIHSTRGPCFSTLSDIAGVLLSIIAHPLSSAVLRTVRESWSVQNLCVIVPSTISMESGGTQWPAWLTAHTGWRYPNILWSVCMKVL